MALSLCIGLSLSFAISNLSSCSSYALASAGGQEATEAASYKPPLIWRAQLDIKHPTSRADKAGYYLLSKLDENTVNELIDAIEIPGQIQSLTATWEFKGEVTLELSANNGQNYSAVVYGTPVSDFISGDQLKWRATLGPDSELFEIRVAYIDTEDVGGTFGSPELSGFRLRRPIYITNPSGEDLFNYQTEVKVGEGITANDVAVLAKTEADFKDVRFTAADGETVLAHYLEKIEGATPNRTAVFYVKVPQLPATGLSLYIYYGNTEAEDISTAEDTFDFFDDFSSSSLTEASATPARLRQETTPNLEKWETTITASISDGQLRLEDAELLSKTYQIKDGIIEYRARADTGNEIRLILRSEKDEAFHDATNQIAYSSVYEGVEHCIVVGNIVKANQAQAIVSGLSYDYRVIVKGTDLAFERYAIHGMPYSTREASITYNDTGGLTSGSIGLKAGADCVNYYDWIRVRKYVNLEPYISSTGMEESVSLAQFSGTGLAENGNVIIKYRVPLIRVIKYRVPLIPTYTTAPIFTACDISVITPTIKNGVRRGGQGTRGAIQIDISADGGVSWNKDCESGRRYSAPLDFIAGKQLLLRANFPTSVIAGDSEAISISELKLEYSTAPIVTSENVYCTGATGSGGVYTSGDTITVKWDNSVTGDNNSNISTVSCNFESFGGENAAMMYDGYDNIYITSYELPEEINTTANIIVTAINRCGIAGNAGQILKVNTSPDEIAAVEEVTSEESAEDQEDLMEKGQRPGTRLYDVLIKLGDNHHPDPEEDARGSYKHGTVVTIRASGHFWSKTERDSFLIVQAYLTEEEVQQLLKPKEIAANRLDKNGKPVMKRTGRRDKRFQLEELGLSSTDKRKEKVREVGELLKF